MFVNKRPGATHQTLKTWNQKLGTICVQGFTNNMVISQHLWPRAYGQRNHFGHLQLQDRGFWLFELRRQDVSRQHGGSGAASVFMHILSPQSQGLFSRAIMQSGSALCDWALEGEPFGYAREVAQRVKCPTDSANSIIDCLRLKPVLDILNAQKDTKIFGDYPLRAVPVVEKSGEYKFLPDTPINLLNAGNFRRVPLMAESTGTKGPSSTRFS
ncbi:esterase FE4 [Caerostris extrusa]|uniref:Esterase FE4 n=1 Tax=Caerostris extrusa TaxID=172846 RepID=A0AAV4XGE6_CAEEX|nr:esterase FE4 [Caerostris extrusa]